MSSTDQCYCKLVHDVTNINMMSSTDQCYYKLVHDLTQYEHGELDRPVLLQVSA